MSKMIQIRHVPDSLHRRLKARAALEGLSLSDYLRREVAQIAQVPTLQEMVERLAGLPAAPLRESNAAAVRAEREAR